MAIQQANKTRRKKKIFFTKLQMREKSTNLSRFSICGVKRKEEKHKVRQRGQSSAWGRRSNRTRRYVTKFGHNRKSLKIKQNADSRHEVTRDVLLLSTSSVREREHCSSVKSSAVTPTQNDSVDPHKTFAVALSFFPSAQIL